MTVVVLLKKANI